MKKEGEHASGQTAEDLLFEAVSVIRNAEEAKLFLMDLCTPAELQVMASRWLVVDPIKKGVPYRKIYDETGGSVTTIGRVARAISYGSGGYDLIYKRLQKRKYAKKQIKNRNPKKGALE